MYKYLHTNIQIWLRHVNSSLWEVCDIIMDHKNDNIWKIVIDIATMMKIHTCSLSRKSFVPFNGSQ